MRKICDFDLYQEIERRGNNYLLLKGNRCYIGRSSKWKDYYSYYISGSSASTIVTMTSSWKAVIINDTAAKLVIKA